MNLYVLTVGDEQIWGESAFKELGYPEIKRMEHAQLPENLEPVLGSPLMYMQARNRLVSPYEQRIRASWIKMLETVEDEDYALLCESDCVPRASYAMIKSLAQKATGADLIVPFAWLEYGVFDRIESNCMLFGYQKFMLAPTVTGALSGAEWHESPMDFCRAFWGMHALIINKQGRERLAAHLKGDLQACDCAMACAVLLGRVVALKANRNLFVQHRDHKSWSGEERNKR